MKANEKINKQAEAEVVRSSSLVEIEVEVGVEVGVQRQNAYIAYVKNQNSYSCEMAFKSVKYHLTLWSMAIYKKISHKHT